MSTQPSQIKCPIPSSKSQWSNFDGHWVATSWWGSRPVLADHIRPGLGRGETGSCFENTIDTIVSIVSIAVDVYSIIFSNHSKISIQNSRTGQNSKILLVSASDPRGKVQGKGKTEVNFLIRRANTKCTSYLGVRPLMFFVFRKRSLTSYKREVLKELFHIKH